MKVTFIGNPADPSDETKVCDVFGKTFFRGIEQDVSDLDDHAKRKLMANSHFTVSGFAAVEAAAAETPKRGPGRPRKVDAPAEDGAE